MASIHEKKDLILKYENRFADRVAVAVIDKPQLNIWMILIPVIFIHYFYRLKKFTDGRKEFAGHFIITRQRALEEAFLSMESGGEPDIGKLIRMSSAPEQSHNDYKAWLKVLVDHYRDLLRSGGNDLESMIRAVYKTRSNYLLYINHLNRVESQFNAALKPSLKKTTDGVNDVISRIEQRCISLRREEAQTIFP